MAKPENEVAALKEIPSKTSVKISVFEPIEITKIPRKWLLANVILNGAVNVFIAKEVASNARRQMNGDIRPSKVINTEIVFSEKLLKRLREGEGTLPENSQDIINELIANGVNKSIIFDREGRRRSIAISLSHRFKGKERLPVLFKTISMVSMTTEGVRNDDNGIQTHLETL